MPSRQRRRPFRRRRCISGGLIRFGPRRCIGRLAGRRHDHHGHRQRHGGRRHRQRPSIGGGNVVVKQHGINVVGNRTISGSCQQAATSPRRRATSWPTRARHEQPLPNGGSSTRRQPAASSATTATVLDPNVLPTTASGLRRSVATSSPAEQARYAPQWRVGGPRGSSEITAGLRAGCGSTSPRRSLVAACLRGDGHESRSRRPRGATSYMHITVPNNQSGQRRVLRRVLPVGLRCHEDGHRRRCRDRVHRLRVVDSPPDMGYGSGVRISSDTGPHAQNHGRTRPCGFLEIPSYAVDALEQHVLLHAQAAQGSRGFWPTARCSMMFVRLLRAHPSWGPELAAQIDTWDENDRTWIGVRGAGFESQAFAADYGDEVRAPPDCFAPRWLHGARRTACPDALSPHEVRSDGRRSDSLSRRDRDRPGCGVHPRRGGCPLKRHLSGSVHSSTPEPPQHRGACLVPLARRRASPAVPVHHPDLSTSRRTWNARPASGTWATTLGVRGSPGGPTKTRRTRCGRRCRSTHRPVLPSVSSDSMPEIGAEEPTTGYRVENYKPVNSSTRSRPTPPGAGRFAG